MADESELRVEQVSARSGVSVATIRYYQSRKLLRPPRREGRVAWYDDQHLRTLERIRDLAAQGFSLTQIGRILAEPSPGDDPVRDALSAGQPSADLDRQTLARVTGTPPFVLDVLVGAGLVTPTSIDGSERFDHEAVDMLDAAAAVARTGAPIDKLLALAQRHHAHVEALVDDAVRLVHDSASSSGISRSQLAPVIERLVPAASQLVAAHFRRTLLARALAEVSSPAMVRVRTVELDGEPDGLALFENAAQPDNWRVLWHHPERDVTLAATGAAVVLDAGAARGDPAGRFAQAAQSLAELRKRIDIESAGEAPAPTLVGGFAFAGQPHDEPDPRWAPLGPGALILPEICVLRRGGRSWLQLAAAASDPHVLDRLHRQALSLLATSTASPPGSSVQLATHPDVDDEYKRLVGLALDAIQAGDVDKVVVARAVELTGEADVTIGIERLRAANPRCVTFAFAFGSTCFLGATPELLVDISDGAVCTSAVAGTRPRSDDPITDDANAAELCASSKERAEHEFVVEFVSSALTDAGVSLDPAPPVEIERFAAVMHLVTRLSGRSRLGADGLVELVGRLHPTPAVGGTPVNAASRWLGDHEGLDRGWYAGPIGVIDLDGNGEFWVALRSALAHDTGLTAYVGAGVVAGSDPDHELAETTAKLATIAGAFGVTW